MTTTTVALQWRDLIAPGVRGTTIGQAVYGNPDTVLYRDHSGDRAITAHHSRRMAMWLVEGNEAWWIVEHAPTDDPAADGPPLRGTQLFTSEDDLNAAWEQLFDPS